MDDLDIVEMLVRSPHVSGEEISARLGMTRAAVWKRMEKLREQGFDIRSAGRNGYYINVPADALHPAYWKHKLAEGWAAREAWYFQELDSTNAEAKRRAIQGAAHGTLVLAEAQSAGRGRRGRGWHSPQGAGLWLSMVLRPDMAPDRLAGLTLLIALAVADACERVSGVRAGVKWPNDVVVGGKKVCGILLEMAANPEAVEWVVAGVGINVRQCAEDFPQELRASATSLVNEGGEVPERRELLLAFLEALERLYAAWADGGMEALRADMLARSVTLGQLVRVEAPGETFVGTAKDIDETGALWVEYEDGTLRRVLAADVSVRGVMGYAGTF